MMRAKNGFSLVELTVVLVIAGLLLGGVLVGRSMLRTAELRHITMAAQRFVAAHHNFYDQYSAAPGDFTEATTLWGVLAGDGNDSICQDTPATGKATCNGNGNGGIDTSAVQYDERFRYWQHLANAKLLEGRYTGRTDGATGGFKLVSGVNIPVIQGGMVTVDPFTQPGDTYQPYSPTAYAFPATYNSGDNTLAFRGAHGAGAMMSPADAWKLDSKLDDGLPGYGIVIGPQAGWSGSPNCTSSNDRATAIYNLHDTQKRCRFNLTVP